MAMAATTPGSSALHVRWSDGADDSFDYFWLRDNCRCPECGDKSGGHRYLELTEIELDIAPVQVVLKNPDALEIVWGADGHRSAYGSEWLRQRSHTLRRDESEVYPRVLWDDALSNHLPCHDYAQVKAGNAARLALFEDIHRYGFTRLRGVPTDHDEVERVAALAGYIRQTHYGRVFDLLATPKQRILAQTSHAIRPHNDELFRDPTPGIMVMHCLVASDDGRGESTLVDGFHAASQLAQTDSEAFEILTCTPMTHERVLSDGVDDVALRATWRAITLDDAGSVSAVRVNERTMAPLDVDHANARPIYAALRKFLSLLYAPAAAIQFRMEPGDAMLFDNHRVLHARRAFSGSRHIRQCHVDRDEFLSRLRVLRASDSPGCNQA
jgi:gamma-butyrobetaine dioxygenase